LAAGVLVVGDPVGHVYRVAELERPAGVGFPRALLESAELGVVLGEVGDLVLVLRPAAGGVRRQVRVALGAVVVGEPDERVGPALVVVVAVGAAAVVRLPLVGDRGVVGGATVALLAGQVVPPFAGVEHGERAEVAQRVSAVARLAVGIERGVDVGER